MVLSCPLPPLHSPTCCFSLNSKLLHVLYSSDIKRYNWLSYKSQREVFYLIFYLTHPFCLILVQNPKGLQSMKFSKKTSGRASFIVQLLTFVKRQIKWRLTGWNLIKYLYLSCRTCCLLWRCWSRIPADSAHWEPGDFVWPTRGSCPA